MMSTVSNHRSPSPRPSLPLAPTFNNNTNIKNKNKNNNNNNINTNNNSNDQRSCSPSSYQKYYQNKQHQQKRLHHEPNKQKEVLFSPQTLEVFHHPPSEVHHQQNQKQQRQFAVEKAKRNYVLLPYSKNSISTAEEEADEHKHQLVKQQQLKNSITNSCSTIVEMSRFFHCSNNDAYNDNQQRASSSASCSSTLDHDDFATGITNSTTTTTTTNSSLRTRVAENFQLEKKQTSSASSSEMNGLWIRTHLGFIQATSPKSVFLLPFSPLDNFSTGEELDDEVKNSENINNNNNSKKKKQKKHHRRNNSTSNMFNTTIVRWRNLSNPSVLIPIYSSPNLRSNIVGDLPPEESIVGTGRLYHQTATTTTTTTTTTEEASLKHIMTFVECLVSRKFLNISTQNINKGKQLIFLPIGDGDTRSWLVPERGGNSKKDLIFSYSLPCLWHLSNESQQSQYQKSQKSVVSSQNIITTSNNVTHQKKKRSSCSRSPSSKERLPLAPPLVLDSHHHHQHQNNTPLVVSDDADLNDTLRTENGDSVTLFNNIGDFSPAVDINNL